jgi:hypothetical protein
MPIERLNLSGCQRITDLSALQGMPLRHLYIGADDGNLTPHGTQACAVSNLSALKGLRLERLDIFKMRVTDLAPLTGMPLEWLSLRETQVTDLSPLKGMPLRYLDCATNNIEDFSALSHSPIERLNISSTRVNRLVIPAGIAPERG